MFIHVSNQGHDGNEGTEENPVKTIQQAVKFLLESPDNDNSNAEIIFREGKYRLLAPIIIDAPEISRKFNSLTLTPFKDESVTISGAMEVSLRWKPYKRGIFQAKLPKELITPFIADDPISQEILIDQLYINGHLHQMARYPKFPGNYEIKGKGASRNALSRGRIRKWKKPRNGIIHGLALHKWGSVHYRILRKSPTRGIKKVGGDQINRFAPLHPTLRYIENVFEELSAPGEWYYSAKNEMLYFLPPKRVDLQNSKAEIVFNRELIRIQGNADNPIKNMTFKNLTFTQTRRVMIDPFEPLLRGDWSIVRKAAIFLSGVENISIDGCSFDHCGGNAIFLSDYCRNIKINRNHFQNIGESAIAIVGNLEAVRSPAIEYRNSVPLAKIDRTPGPNSNRYPKQCVVSNNLIHDSGMWGKQTAGVFLSMAEEISILNNTMYSLPRAGICVNDGTWGGHLVKNNWIFNTVRETGDHGPLNSWGRDRHWQTNHAGNRKGDQEYALQDCLLDSWHPTVIDHNRFEHYITNSWGIDLDDGSSNYIVRNNLCLGCSIKLREGFYRVVENNIFIATAPPEKHMCYRNNQDVVRYNISIITGKTGLWPHPTLKLDEVKEIDKNLYFSGEAVNEDLLKQLHLDSATPAGKIHKAQRSLEKVRSKNVELHSIWDDPLFIDTAKYDFQVSENSPALALGFKNFPMDSFGTSDAHYQVQAEYAYETYIKQLTPEETKILGEDNTTDWYGARIKNLNTPAEQSATGMPEITGVLFISVPQSSKAHHRGFRPNDVVLRIGKRDATKVSQFLELMKKTQKKKFKVTVFRAQQEYNIL